ncbi:MAG: Hsp20 family protein [Candidatus Hodarchaeota archaeon]
MVFSLPENINNENIEANLDKGILTILKVKLPEAEIVI